MAAALASVVDRREDLVIATDLPEVCALCFIQSPTKSFRWVVGMSSPPQEY